MFNAVVAKGRMDRSACKQLVDAAGRLRAERVEANADLHRQNIERRPKSAFVTSDAAVLCRREAKDNARYMMQNAVAMNLGTWLADEIGVRFVADQAFGPGINRAERGVYPLLPEGMGLCNAYVWGPYVHGKMCQVDELKACQTCLEKHGVRRLLCVNCRDDRDRAQGELRHCLTGYCPAFEMATHADWGMGWSNPPSWVAHSGYDPNVISLQRRIEQFRRYHPDPRGTMEALRQATQTANVGRDLTGVGQPRAYGAGQGARTQLARAIAPE